MATAMLDRGADIRYIQEMLGHQHLGTTQLYTHVSIQRLRAVHHATHPAERPGLDRAPANPPAPPGLPPDPRDIYWLPMTPAEIVGLRWRSGLDAAAFAALLNVPVATLAGLEGGASTPDGPLLRLLQILARIPTLLATLHAELPRA